MMLVQQTELVVYLKYYYYLLLPPTRIGLLGPSPGELNTRDIYTIYIIEFSLIKDTYDLMMAL
jgi:hypothetical protein